MNKNLIAAVSGVIFESYNNTLYGFFAVFLASIFFPPESFIPPGIASFLTFSAGYVLRPIGGLIFGLIGDNLGRKVSLKLSIFFIAVPTLIIGCLPSYQSVGSLAPFILLLCRLVQGISTGSDYTGVIIYVAEQRGVNNPILVTCFLVCCGFLGAFLGTLVSLGMVAFLPLGWGWRLAFILGGLMSIGVYFLRRNMDETLVFKEKLSLPPRKSSPLFSLFKEDKRKMLACCIMGGGNLVPVYLATIYFNVELKNILNLSLEGILLNNCFILLTGAILVLVSYFILRRVDEVRVIKAVMYWFIFFSIPIYMIAMKSPSFLSFLSLQVFIMLGDAPQIAALALLLPKLFPSDRRYSGIGLSYALGQALIGGTTPLIAMYLVNITGHPWAPSYFLFFISVIYLIAIMKMRAWLKEVSP